MVKLNGRLTAKLSAAAVLAMFVTACATREPPIPPPVPKSGPVIVTPQAPRTPPTPPAPIGPAAGSAEDFRVTVNERVFFALDRHDLSPEARLTLERQAAWLRTYQSVSIRIEGNADERGTREYNLALGEKRANSAKNYLVSLGVDPGRISVVSYGKERPVALASDESAWAQNRRAASVIIN